MHSFKSMCDEIKEEKYSESQEFNSLTNNIAEVSDGQLNPEVNDVKPSIEEFNFKTTTNFAASLSSPSKVDIKEEEIPEQIHKKDGKNTKQVAKKGKYRIERSKVPFICKGSIKLKSRLNIEKCNSYELRDTMDDSLTCSMCNFLAESPTQLTKHINKKHKIPAKTIFKCKNCTYKSTRRWLVNLHIRRLHCLNPNELFSCSVCNYKSKLESYVKRHMKSSHEELKLFHCSVCSNRFYQKQQLKSHFLTAH